MDEWSNLFNIMQLKKLELLYVNATDNNPRWVTSPPADNKLKLEDWCLSQLCLVHQANYLTAVYLLLLCAESHKSDLSIKTHWLQSPNTEKTRFQSRLGLLLEQMNEWQKQRRVNSQFFPNVRWQLQQEFANNSHDAVFNYIYLQLVLIKPKPRWW